MLLHTPQCPPCSYPILTGTQPQIHSHPLVGFLLQSSPLFKKISIYLFIFVYLQVFPILPTLVLSSFPEVVKWMKERSTGSVSKSTGCPCCLCKGTPKQAVKLVAVQQQHQQQHTVLYYCKSPGRRTQFSIKNWWGRGVFYRVTHLRITKRTCIA